MDDLIMPAVFNPITLSDQQVPAARIWQKLLLGCACRLDPSGRVSQRIMRIARGKELKHMRNVGPNFALRATEDPTIWDIFWKKRHLGRTAPLPGKIPGEDIWLLATGPSISGVDLGRLRDRAVLGLNGAIVNCREAGILPSHYAITDRDFFEHRMPLVLDAVRSGAHCLFSFNGLARICEHSPELFETGRISLLQTVNRYYGIPQLPEAALRQALRGHPELVVPGSGDPRIGWSRDMTHGVFTANTIAYIGCQIAESLGAGNAYILGMDLGSGRGVPLRSYEEGKDARPTTLDKDYERVILPAFELLSGLETGCKFWNLSAVSRLPEAVMPGLSYDDALER